MEISTSPISEQTRLEELISYGVLDTPPEEVFDRITRLAAKTLNVPIAVVSLFDKHRQWFKSRYGITATETPREVALCSRAIEGPDIFVVLDTKTHEGFRDQKIMGEPFVRFYAGMPLVTPRGLRLGTLCIADYAPKTEFDEESRAILRDLTSMVMEELNHRLTLIRAQNSYEERQRLIDEIQLVNRRKSEFLIHVSHELRNPLNAIIGYTDLLTSEPHGPLGDTRYARYVDAIQGSGQHMLALVTDILEYAKLKGDDHELVMSTVVVSEILAEAGQMLAQIAIKKGVSLVYPEVENGLVVRVDTIKLRQAVINLISNAIKFTSKGGAITVDTRRENGFIIISVKDTGIGIAPNDVARAMAPFGQINPQLHTAGRVDQPEGFGLGLPITKRLIERHGGHLDIQTELGVGTEVLIYLPEEN